MSVIKKYFLLSYHNTSSFQYFSDSLLCIFSGSILFIRCPNVSCSSDSHSATRQTRAVDPRMAQCWRTVRDAGPTLSQHWVNGSCLLGEDMVIGLILLLAEWCMNVGGCLPIQGGAEVIRYNSKA